MASDLLIGESRGVVLRHFTVSDLPAYREWLQPGQEWQRWDGPYNPVRQPAEIDAGIERLRGRIVDGTLRAAPIERAVVAASDDPTGLMGMVSWHWEAEESDWRRMGVTVFDPAARGRGSGTEALRIWTDYLFAHTDAVRLDFSTWSGNTRMLGVGHRLGFTEEARFRNAREVRGERYDSVVMGVLRAEWLAQGGHSALT
ncbi:GNAT family N-acetyltransferase [Microbacterium terricola]|uniref:N-acetyltransferase n=1 Tax=Microbacterium terricola TaxID=344163 RepID=A0ABM8E284_9MICO|nr:GNAT family protein [Microbacterium terricola]UYK40390.1 GNAT family N-acetyltransferase [Microbacterium terricola]BDV31892.1 N-acetyltransferase [Microbacterium terricola]